MNNNKNLEPCAQPDEWIIQVAEALAEKQCFPMKSEILDVVTALRGKVQYVDPDEIFPDKAKITVHKECVENVKFTIEVSMAAFPLQEKYSIAHELGHYILHSDFGTKQIRATEARHYNENDPVEREANLFASAFLMPRKQIQALEIRSDRRIASHFGVPFIFAKNWLNYLGALHDK